MFMRGRLREPYPALKLVGILQRRASWSEAVTKVNVATLLVPGKFTSGYDICKQRLVARLTRHSFHQQIIGTMWCGDLPLTRPLLQTAVTVFRLPFCREHSSEYIRFPPYRKVPGRDMRGNTTAF